jgi:hypothetical protein
MACNGIMTLTINVLETGALPLLQDMERLNLIRVTASAGTAAGGQKLSERFAGALHLSDQEYAGFQAAIEQGRNEWARDIF